MHLGLCAAGCSVLRASHGMLSFWSKRARGTEDGLPNLGLISRADTPQVQRSILLPTETERARAQALKDLLPSHLESEGDGGDILTWKEERDFLHAFPVPGLWDMCVGFAPYAYKTGRGGEMELFGCLLFSIELSRSLSLGYPGTLVLISSDQYIYSQLTRQDLWHQSHKLLRWWQTRAEAWTHQIRGKGDRLCEQEREDASYLQVWTLRVPGALARKHESSEWFHIYASIAITPIREGAGISGLSR